MIAVQSKHWTPARMGWLFRPISERDHPDETVLSVFRDHGVVPKDSRSDNFNRTPESLNAYQLVQPGDLVVNRMKAWQGSLGISPYRGIVSPDYEILRPITTDVDPRYLHQLLRSRPLIDQYGMRSTGIRPSQWRLYWDQMKTIEVALPPLEEQRAIADYLDHETAKIDTLIAKQEQLIATLRERRSAMIRQAVSLPDSEGSVTDKLGRRCRIGNGSTPRRENASYWHQGSFPWLNSAVVNQRRVTESDQFVTELALHECHLPVVSPGSVLVGLTGQGRTRGMAALLETRATVSQHVAYVAPEQEHWFPTFLLWSLTAVYDELRQLSDENGSTKGGLTCMDLKRFRLARPPLEEQRRIAVYLEEQTAKIDTLIAKADRFIELSKERRAALITAAVTGQVDVRASA